MAFGLAAEVHSVFACSALESSHSSKLLSLRSCWKVQNVLVRKLALNYTNLAIVDGARMWDYYFMHNDMRPENMWTGSQTQERVGERPAFRTAQKRSTVQQSSALRCLGARTAAPCPALQTLGRRAQWLRQHPAWSKSLRQQTQKDCEECSPGLRSQAFKWLE